MAGQSNVEKASEEVIDFVCGPCHLDGEVIQAKGYCSNCQDYLCNTCLKHHLRSKPSRHHVLLDENSMPKDKKATSSKLSDTCTKICPKHSGNIIEYYCTKHDFLGCTKCFISDNHRMCKGVVCIEDVTADLFKSPEYKTYEGKIEQISKDLSKSSVLQTENDENITKYSIRAKREIQNFRTSMNSFLDRLEHEMEKQVSVMTERQTLKLMSTSQHIVNLDENIGQMKRTNEQTRNSGQRCDSYINMKRNVHQLKQFQDRIEKIKTDVMVSEYVFKPDAHLKNVIKDAKTFGKLEKDNTELIDALTKRLKYYENKNKNIPPRRPQYLMSEDEDDEVESFLKPMKNHCLQYSDAIRSVKAGRHVNFHKLSTPPGFPPLPSQDEY